jgi:hypothetical protein
MRLDEWAEGMEVVRSAGPEGAVRASPDVPGRFLLDVLVDDWDDLSGLPPGHMRHRVRTPAWTWACLAGREFAVETDADGEVVSVRLVSMS